MNLLAFFLIAALSVFVLGILYRASRILRMPAHLRWELYPVPKGPREKQLYGGSYFEETDWWTKRPNTTRGGELVFMLKEVLLLRGVREHFRELWIWSLMLHWGLYLYIAYIALVFLAAVSNMVALPAMATFLVFVTACCGGVLGSIGVFGTRLVHPRLRGYTSRASFFNLAFLCAIFATGLLAAFDSRVDFAVPLRFSTGASSWAALAHLALLGLFLVYFPFTHMTHMFMKYFTWHRVRWDDLPSRFDKCAQRKVDVSLGRPVSWQAPHIRSAESKSWSAIAASSGQTNGAAHD